jgi:protein farnesyltransferase/geranylgeranyltransferase type-1 subunit alpha
MVPEEIPLLFSDLKPVPQEDGPIPVCQIDYSADFVLAYDYFRALLLTNERSERALALTEVCLTFNPANYTVWHVRRECVDALGWTEERLDYEWNLASRLGGPNPKNYQIAFHRRCALEAFSRGFLVNEDTTISRHNLMTTRLHEAKAKQELKYLATVLTNVDGKNYHVWSSRQWILREINLESWFAEEIDFCHELTEQDCRNNSAWNQRWFSVHRGLKTALDAELAQQEVDYTFRMVSMDPYNESPWRYLIGILREQQPSTRRHLIDHCRQAIPKIQNVLSNASRDPDACANLNSARIDLLEMEGSKECIQEAISLCKAMSEQHDTIRSKYWDFRIVQLQTKIATIS